MSEGLPQRRKLQLLPRSKVVEEMATTPVSENASDAEDEDDTAALDTMSEEEHSRRYRRIARSTSPFEEGFASVAEFLDDIAVNVPKAPNLMAMLEGSGLDQERRDRIAAKLEDPAAFLDLLS
jgi:hypothetical protein